MAVSTTTVKQQIQVERGHTLALQVMRLKQLVEDYDKELEASLVGWGVIAELTGHWNRYGHLHKRAQELRAIGE